MDACKRASGPPLICQINADDWHRSSAAEKQKLCEAQHVLIRGLIPEEDRISMDGDAFDKLNIPPNRKLEMHGKFDCLKLLHSTEFF